MKVYILEDEIVQQFRLESLVKNYMQQKKYPVEEIVTCDRSWDLLASLEESSRNNIYFLDIAIKGNQNAGLEIAEKIRKLDAIGQISFVTTHNEFASITYEYKVNAHDFIDKILPQKVFDERIIANIDHYITINRLKGTSKNSNLPLLAKFTYRVVIAPNLTAVSFVAMPSARKIYLKSYQKQFLEVPLNL